MADLRTTVTELVTGLGMTGYESIDAALDSRPVVMASVSPEQWNQLENAYNGGALAAEFESAFSNGRAFLQAREGLRERTPMLIEWKGAQANPGDQALPVDLRIDHVYLVSCKYLSKIVHNAAPARVFDQSLKSTPSSRAGDWYDEVAPEEHQALYEATVDHCRPDGDLPAKVQELTRLDRAELRASYPKRWPASVEDRYLDLCRRVGMESATRWRARLTTKAEQEATLWRLLRLGPAPYFVLGSSRAGTLRLRIATPWDWRQEFSLVQLKATDRAGGQPVVAWEAVVKSRHSGELTQIEGHVEVRWSHGRFGGFPEAKIYLDSPHSSVPGYFALS